jgi:hypothetical protein
MFDGGVVFVMDVKGLTKRGLCCGCLMFDGGVVCVMDVKGLTEERFVLWMLKV